ARQHLPPDSPHCGQIGGTSPSLTLPGCFSGVFPIKKAGQHGSSEHAAHPTKLRQSGASISHQTVARWRRRGWRPLEREQHPLEVTGALLDDAVPILTMDAMTTAKVLVEDSAERDEQMPESELLRRAARALAADVILVVDAFMQHPETFTHKPETKCSSKVLC